LTPGDIIEESLLKIDSGQLAEMARDFAQANGKEVQSINYDLSKDGAQAVPLWKLQCFDKSGAELCELQVTSTQGKVVLREFINPDSTLGAASGPPPVSVPGRRGSSSSPSGPNSKRAAHKSGARNEGSNEPASRKSAKSASKPASRTASKSSPSRDDTDTASPSSTRSRGKVVSRSKPKEDSAPSAPEPSPKLREAPPETQVASQPSPPRFFRRLFRL
jgi:hypothetical protein